MGPSPQLENIECSQCPQGNRNMRHVRTSVWVDFDGATVHKAHFRCSKNPGHRPPEPQGFDPGADPRLIPAS